MTVYKELLITVSSCEPRVETLREKENRKNIW